MPGLQERLGFKNSRSWRYFIYLSVPWALFCIYSLPSIWPNILCNGGSGPWQAPPGGCYWYAHKTITRYGTGVMLHLASVLPAGILAVLQFTPSIRQRYRKFHKYAGYVAMALVLTGNIGGLMIMDRAFGGDVAIQSLVVSLAVMTTWAGIKAVNEARYKRFASHRAWMLRTWAYLGAILTMRPLIPFTAAIISFLPVAQQWVAISCGEILEMTREKPGFGVGGLSNMNMTLAKWPACNPTTLSYSAEHMIPVRANLGGEVPAEAGAALRAVFGPVAWFGLMFNALVVEYYLNSTRESSSRPKQRAVPTASKVVSESTRLLDGVVGSEQSRKEVNHILAAS